MESHLKNTNRTVPKRNADKITVFVQKKQLCLV